MKEFFKYTGLIVFTLFSFYYTDRVVEKAMENDSIMVSITKFAEDHNIKCSEGYITEEGVVLGISGLMVNEHASYTKMKGVGYKEELIEFEKDKCIVSRENNMKNYILKGNEIKSSISLILEITDLKNVDSFTKIAKEKNIKLDLLVNNIILKDNEEKFKNLYLEGYNILFNGKDEEDLKEFLSILKEFDKNYQTFCIDSGNNILEICSKRDINTVKSKVSIEKMLLSNIKKTLHKGAIIVIHENTYNLNELSATVNYIESKGLKIVSIKEHLS